MKNYQINLLPKELQPGLHLNWRQLLPYLAATGLAGTLLSGYIFTTLAAAHLEEELAGLETAINNTKPVARQVEQWQQETATLRNWTDQFRQTRAQRFALYQVLRDINTCVPLDLQLTAISTGENQSGTISGGQKAGSAPEQKSTGAQPTPLQPRSTAPASSDSGNTRVGEALEQTATADNKSGTAAGVSQTGGAALSRPATISLQGVTPGLSEVGALIYNLQQLPYFTRIQLQDISKEQSGQLTFHIIAVLREK
ncbi:MAG: PilN domain-containing protein [Desulfurispora sp.]|uniref:PilN domain-containing protein n=1 Tax=Desulfurispora sp. TaxID=3014275 RepID=UPI004049DBA8